MLAGWQYLLEFQGQQHELEDGEVVIGRSRSCDLSIVERSVSRRHVRMTLDEGRVTVADLGSSNGTYVRGRRVTEPVSISDGDEIDLGDCRMRFRILVPDLDSIDVHDLDESLDLDASPEGRFLAATADRRRRE